MMNKTWLCFFLGMVEEWRGFFGAEVGPHYSKVSLPTAHDELTGFTAVNCCMSVGGFKNQVPINGSQTQGCQSNSL